MRADLERALAWMGSPVMMSLLVGFGQTDPEFREKLVRVTDAIKTTEFFVEDEGETRYGLNWAIYDMAFAEIPSDLDSTIHACLELTFKAGSPIAVFVFEDGFGLEYITKPGSARSTYAAQVSGVYLMALDDEVRASSAWAEDLTSLKQTVLGQ
jgi:hypothetical protein